MVNPRLVALLVAILGATLVVRHNVHLSEVRDWDVSLAVLPLAVLGGVALNLVAFPWMVIVAAQSVMFGAPFGVFTGMLTALLATAVQRVVGAAANDGSLLDAVPKTGRVGQAIDHVTHHPLAGVTVLKLVAGQNGLLGYVLGAMRVSWRPLLGGSVIGLFPRAVLCAVIADTFL